jgi:hypothetical protein
MKRDRAGAVATIFLWLGTMTVAVSAHEVEVLYNRQDPIVVAVPYQKIVKVAFWEAVLDVSTTMAQSALEIHQDAHFPHMIQLANVAKKTRGMIYVTTASGTVVHLKIQHWGPPRQKIIVKDAYVEAERAMQRAQAQTEMRQDERAVRALWRAQWGFLPTDPLVQVREIHQVIESGPERQVTLTQSYDTVGFYGFTQHIQNLTREVMPLHPATIGVDCPLFSVALDGHEPALKQGDDPHRIEPGGAVRVHLTCKGVRGAKVR